MTLSERPLVLFHADCQDGLTAAWLARHAMPSAECVPVQYGQEPPDVSGREVYVLDFSYKVSTLRMMADLASRLVCLDHHKTAQEDLKSITDSDPYPDRTHRWSVSGRGIYDKLYVKFDMNKSGGRLAWEYFRSRYGETSPWLVDYTEDRDLWRWKLPASREVSAAMASYPMTFEQWDEFSRWTGAISRLASEGEAILRYQRQQVELACKNAVEIDMGGHKVLSCNATVLISEIGNELCKGRAFSATYFIRNDGKKVWSLRSADDGIDVGEIARRHGGGGNVHAAGFKEG